MDFSKLVGRLFLENSLYETLQFELEENFENYLGQFLHIYFEELEIGKINVTEVVYFETESQFYQANKAVLGKRGYFRICETCGHFDMMICHLNTSGKFSIIRKNYTHIEEFASKSYDHPVRTSAMTADEIRLAFLELRGEFESQQEIDNLKPKKAM